MSVTRKIVSGLRAREIVAPFLRHLLAVGKQEQDKQPRDKGPVIRDGVRPVPRLASRTITLRELESVQTGTRSGESREKRGRESVSFSLYIFLRPFLGSCPYVSYFKNRMITRLRSKFPATCSRSGGVEGEYILSREALSLPRFLPPSHCGGTSQSLSRELPRGE